MANKILLKHIKREEQNITPYYNEDGSLKGVAIKGKTRGMMFQMKYFSDEAKEWLLSKFIKGNYP